MPVLLSINTRVDTPPESIWERRSIQDFLINFNTLTKLFPRQNRILRRVVSIRMAYPYQNKPRIGLIWPRDPQPGKRAKWSFGQRLKDVLTGKGPDIFIGRIDGPTLKPSTARWSRWTDIHGGPEANDLERPPLFKWCDRGNKRYDFRTRTYKVPDVNTWSKVEYRDWRHANWETPRYVWDEQGVVYPYARWRRTHPPPY